MAGRCHSPQNHRFIKLLSFELHGKVQSNGKKKGEGLFDVSDGRHRCIVGQFNDLFIQTVRKCLIE